MKQEIKILIIDSSPMAVQGIKTTLLTDLTIGNSINVTTAYTYEEALCLNNKSWNNENNFDVIIVGVDINFTNSGGMVFGERYVTKIRDIYPNAKIITVILTKDNYRIYHIIKKIKPDGFIVENELDSKELQMVITTVIKCKYYYSKSVHSILKKNKLISNMFDDLDRKILYYLGRDIKTKDLHKFVFRSPSAIEKRKRKIKDVLGLYRGTDKELIKEAKIRQII
ncbi:MAG: hypothetical protein DRJ07_03960 [Bacteroidetes bacterium]|nr:MAG: hypothetical protein DRJ07_03960 [Bacteroidota bacterium]